MAATIRSVETIIVALPREIPYLGPLGEGEHVNGMPARRHLGLGEIEEVAAVRR